MLKKILCVYLIFCQCFFPYFQNFAWAGLTIIHRDHDYEIIGDKKITINLSTLPDTVTSVYLKCPESVTILGEHSGLEHIVIEAPSTVNKGKVYTGDMRIQGDFENQGIVASYTDCQVEGSGKFINNGLIHVPEKHWLTLRGFTQIQFMAEETQVVLGNLLIDAPDPDATCLINGQINFLDKRSAACIVCPDVTVSALFLVPYFMSFGPEADHAHYQFLNTGEIHTNYSVVQGLHNTGIFTAQESFGKLKVSSRIKDILSEFGYSRGKSLNSTIQFNKGTFAAKTFRALQTEPLTNKGDFHIEDSLDVAHSSHFKAQYPGVSGLFLTGTGRLSMGENVFKPSLSFMEEMPSQLLLAGDSHSNLFLYDVPVWATPAKFNGAVDIFVRSLQSHLSEFVFSAYVQSRGPMNWHNTYGNHAINLYFGDPTNEQDQFLMCAHNLRVMAKEKVGIDSGFTFFSAKTFILGSDYTHPKIVSNKGHIIGTEGVYVRSGQYRDSGFLKSTKDINLAIDETMHLKNNKMEGEGINLSAREIISEGSRLISSSLLNVKADYIKFLAEFSGRIIKLTSKEGEFSGSLYAKESTAINVNENFIMKDYDLYSPDFHASGNALQIYNGRLRAGHLSIYGNTTVALNRNSILFDTASLYSPYFNGRGNTLVGDTLKTCGTWSGNTFAVNRASIYNPETLSYNAFMGHSLSISTGQSSSNIFGNKIWTDYFDISGRDYNIHSNHHQGIYHSFSRERASHEMIHYVDGLYGVQQVGLSMPTANLEIGKGKTLRLTHNQFTLDVNRISNHGTIDSRGNLKLYGNAIISGNALFTAASLGLYSRGHMIHENGSRFRTTAGDLNLTSAGSMVLSPASYQVWMGHDSVTRYRPASLQSSGGFNIQAGGDFYAPVLRATASEKLKIHAGGDLIMPGMAEYYVSDRYKEKSGLFGWNSTSIVRHTAEFTSPQLKGQHIELESRNGQLIAPGAEFRSASSIIVSGNTGVNLDGQKIALHDSTKKTSGWGGWVNDRKHGLVVGSPTHMWAPDGITIKSNEDISAEGLNTHGTPILWDVRGLVDWWQDQDLPSYSYIDRRGPMRTVAQIAPAILAMGAAILYPPSAVLAAQTMGNMALYGATVSGAGLLAQKTLQHEFNLGKSFGSFNQKDWLSIGISGLTSGLSYNAMNKLGLSGKDSYTLTENLARGTISESTNIVVNATFNKDYRLDLSQSLRNVAVNALHADVAGKIGDANLQDWGALGTHFIAGGLAGVAKTGRIDPNTFCRAGTIAAGSHWVAEQKYFDNQKKDGFAGQSAAIGLDLALNSDNLDLYSIGQSTVEHNSMAHYFRDRKYLDILLESQSGDEKENEFVFPWMERLAYRYNAGSHSSESKVEPNGANTAVDSSNSSEAYRHQGKTLDKAMNNSLVNHDTSKSYLLDRLYYYSGIDGRYATNNLNQLRIFSENFANGTVNHLYETAQLGADATVYYWLIKPTQFWYEDSLGESIKISPLARFSYFRDVEDRVETLTDRISNTAKFMGQIIYDIGVTQSPYSVTNKLFEYPYSERAHSRDRLQALDSSLRSTCLYNASECLSSSYNYLQDNQDQAFSSFAYALGSLSGSAALFKGFQTLRGFQNLSSRVPYLDKLSVRRVVSNKSERLSFTSVEHDMARHMEKFYHSELTHEIAGIERWSIVNGQPILNGLKGKIYLESEKMTVYLAWLSGKINLIPEVIPNLKKYAQSKGIKQLVITADFANARLVNVLCKRYGKNVKFKNPAFKDANYRYAYLEEPFHPDLPVSRDGTIATRIEIPLVANPPKGFR